jgi:uncharacterized protein
MVLKKYLLANWLLLWAVLALAQTNVPPKSDRLVNDFAGILGGQEVESLERKLVAYDDSTSTQIAVVTLPTLSGDDIFDYSQRLAESWGIGREGKDNGILLLIATEDRKMRIHTGYGVEGYLTDAMSKRIIQNIIVPAFREGQYYEGIDRATDVFIELGSGEYTNDELAEEGFPIELIIFLVVFFIILIIIISNMGKGGGYYRGGRYDADRGGGWIIFGPGGSGNWSGGGGGGSSWGGGGFGGFGGGGFGGGGASGSW